MTAMSGFEVIESDAGLIKAWTQGVPVEEAAKTQLRNVVGRPHASAGGARERVTGPDARRSPISVASCNTMVYVSGPVASATGKSVA